MHLKLWGFTYELLSKGLNDSIKEDGGWISIGLLLPEANAQGAQDMGVTPQSTINNAKCLFMANMEVSDVGDLLMNIDYLAVYTLFLAETARNADVVFPATAFVEIDGTYTSSERRVQRIFKTTKPPGEARSLWEVVMSIANVMGARWSYHSSQDIMKEISEVVPLYRFITYETIGLRGFYADGIAEGPRYYR